MASSTVPDTYTIPNSGQHSEHPGHDRVQLSPSEVEAWGQITAGFDEQPDSLVVARREVREALDGTGAAAPFLAERDADRRTIKLDGFRPVDHGYLSMITKTAVNEATPTDEVRRGGETDRAATQRIFHATHLLDHFQGEYLKGVNERQLS